MKKIIAIGLTYMAPVFVFAQNDGDINTDYVDQVLTFVRNFVNAVLPVIIALAVLFFLWSLVMFILNSDDESARAAARSRMIWGVVIIFVMVSLRGLVNLLDEFFGLDDAIQNAPDVPAYVPING